MPSRTRAWSSIKRMWIGSGTHRLAGNDGWKFDYEARFTAAACVVQLAAEGPNHGPGDKQAQTGGSRSRLKGLKQQLRRRRARSIVAKADHRQFTESVGRNAQPPMPRVREGAAAILRQIQEHLQKSGMMSAHGWKVVNHFPIQCDTRFLEGRRDHQPELFQQLDDVEPFQILLVSFFQFVRGKL